MIDHWDYLKIRRCVDITDRAAVSCCDCASARARKGGSHPNRSIIQCSLHVYSKLEQRQSKHRNLP